MATAPLFVGAQVPDAGEKTPQRLKAMSEQYEQDGQKAEAAQTYEELIRLDPTSRSVLAPRLVQLYAETRQPQQALAWAGEVMKTNPDPEAYLAAVYTLLGGYNEAQAILEKEIAKTDDVNRKITLLWQLAEVNEREGRIVEADRNLKAAAETAKTTPHEAQAQKRLDAFTQKYSARPEAR